jgi:hypothetical protein
MLLLPAAREKGAKIAAKLIGAKIRAEKMAASLHLTRPAASSMIRPVIKVENFPLRSRHLTFQQPLHEPSQSFLHSLEVLAHLFRRENGCYA